MKSVLDLSGTDIKGYRLIERVGAGGFGAVYKAYQTTVGREVAMKVILPGFASQPEFIRRFETEAQLVARLEHLHIVPLYDYWRDPDGAYLVMRYLKGGNLKDALNAEPFDVRATTVLLDQIASALDIAHRNEVIHRDIKPANILLDEDGNAYLADFGIAKELVKEGITQPDSVVGSLDYFSPEQARNEQVTPRTDIYSLGITLYEMLTGEHPFKGASSVERLYKHLADPLPEITTLDPAICDSLNAVIQRATAKDPAQRYPDVLALALAFREGARLNLSRADHLVEQLTLREQEILQLIITGLSNKQIADKLFVTLATVKWHIKQLYDKLGVRSRVQAIVRARELDLIVTGETGKNAHSGNGALSSSSIVLPEPENPYKGLRAFQPSDARDFFGREEVVEKLLKRMSDSERFARFLAVVGPSGSGKSSLVKAGLIPALWQGKLPSSERWFVVEMLPGAHPLEELEIALIRVAANQAGSLHEQLERDGRGLVRAAQLILPNDGSELVLVIDQFEEVFTLVESETERQHFLDLLMNAAADARSRVRVIVTLRADYYDRPLHYPEFGEILRSRMETVLPLGAKGLERTIAGPAERVGVTFEPGLVAQIVAEMNYQAGALPLLQYALTELFMRRTGRMMTHAAYQAIGGAGGALANRADELYQSLDETGRELTRQVFLRLVTLGEGTEDTRRRVARSELLAIAADVDLLDDIIDTYASYRLLSLDNDPGTRAPTVEVAHEAILREWERLRAWLNDSRDDIKLQRHLSHAADEWRANRQDTSFLLTGARLETFEKWSKETQLALTPLERDFLQVSLEERQRQAIKEQARQEREQAQERRSQTLTRWLIVVLMLATVGAFILSAVALTQRQTAIENAATAHNTTLLVGAQAAIANKHMDLALALALEAYGNDASSPFAQVMLAETAYKPATILRYIGHAARVNSVVMTPDGSQIISGAEHGELFLWDMATGELLHRFEGHPSHENSVGDDFVPGLAITSDGKTLLSGDSDGTIIMWDMETRQMIRTLKAHQATISSIYLSPDEQTFVTSSWDGTAKVWDFVTGNQRLEFTEHTGQVWSAQFSLDGQSIVSTGDTPDTYRWDTATGTIQQRYEGGHTSGVNRVAFSPDGQHMLSAGDDAEIVIWDVKTGEALDKLSGHTSWIPTVAYSPDGKYALSAGNDGKLILWDMTTHQSIETFLGHTGELTSGIFNLDGSLAVSASRDGSLRLWRLFDGQIQHQLDKSELSNTDWWTMTLDWSATRNLALTSWFSNITALWNTDNGQIIRTMEGSTSILSPDETRAFVGLGAPYSTEPAVGKLLDLDTGEVIQEFTGFDMSIISVAYSPDGKTILTSTGDNAGHGSLYLWDVETGEMLFGIPRFEPAAKLAYSPDSAMVYAYHVDGVVIARAVPSGEELFSFKAHDFGAGFNISPDGSRLVTGGVDNTIVLWDAATGTRLREFTGHTGPVYDVEFSADGQTIVSSSADNSVIMWDVDSGQMLRRYGELSGAVSKLLLSPDGHELLVGYGTGTVQTWRIDSQAALVEWIPNNRYIPDFSCSERELYRIEPFCISDA